MMRFLARKDSNWQRYYPVILLHRPAKLGRLNLQWNPTENCHIGTITLGHFSHFDLGTYSVCVCCRCHGNKRKQQSTSCCHSIVEDASGLAPQLGMNDRQLSFQHPKNTKWWKNVTWPHSRDPFHCPERQCCSMRDCFEFSATIGLSIHTPMWTKQKNK